MTAAHRASHVRLDALINRLMASMKSVPTSADPLGAVVGSGDAAETIPAAVNALSTTTQPSPSVPSAAYKIRVARSPVISETETGTSDVQINIKESRQRRDQEVDEHHDRDEPLQRPQDWQSPSRDPQSGGHRCGGQAIH